MIEELTELTNTVRKVAEDHLGNKYRVTRVQVSGFNAEYYIPNNAWGERNPDEFPLGQLDIQFTVSAMKLPITAGQEKAELTIRLQQDQLVVRKTEFTLYRSWEW